MKRKLLALFLCIISVYAQGETIFISGSKYMMRAGSRNSGYIALGSKYGNATPVYHTSENTVSEDCLWIIEKNNKGTYTFRNASNGLYINFDGLRTDSKRGLDLSETANSDSAQWNIEAEGYKFSIINVANNAQYFNVRSSGIVGTYEGLDSNGEIIFFNEKGDTVTALEAPKPKVSDYINELHFDGKKAVCDNLYNAFLFPLRESMNNEDFRTKVTYKTSSDKYSLLIEGKEVTNGSEVTFASVEGGKEYKLELKTDTGTIADCKITFTFLPLVEITGSTFSLNEYNSGTIRVFNPESATTDSLYQIKIRYRGASASGMKKKAYAVKLIDTSGNSIDRSFMGMRDDNNWILDAMAVDHSRSRNRVSTDLWLDYSAKPYFYSKEPKMINGTHGHFVEVILNGGYAGLYCMTEKIDRKQLKLKKYQEASSASATDTIRGELYKSVQWGYTSYMGYDTYTKTYSMAKPASYNNKSETWAGCWEAKYPDLGDGENIDWAELYNAICVPASYSDNDFTDSVSTYFDMPVVRDYYLHTELLLGFDNIGKNMYFYNYNKQKNKMLSIAPWDMDGTWGRIWDGSKDWCEDYNMDFAIYLVENKAQHALYKRLAELDYKEWEKQLSTRYAELRKTVFIADSLTARFARYREKFAKSGADIREAKRWSGSNGVTLDFDEDLTYVAQWIKGRINALDQQYGYEPTAIGKTTTNDYVGISGSYNAIIIRANKPQDIVIYSLQGTNVKSVRVREGITTIKDIQPGIYIIKNKKVIVK